MPRADEMRMQMRLVGATEAAACDVDDEAEENDDDKHDQEDEEREREQEQEEEEDDDDDDEEEDDNEEANDSAQEGERIVKRRRRGRRRYVPVDQRLATVLKKCIGTEERQRIRGLVLSEHATATNRKGRPICVTSTPWQNVVVEYVDRYLDVLRASKASDGNKAYTDAIGVLRLISEVEARGSANSKQMNVILFEEVCGELHKLIREQFGGRNERFLAYLRGVSCYDDDPYLDEIRDRVSKGIPCPAFVKARLRGGLKQLRRELTRLERFRSQLPAGRVDADEQPPPHTAQAAPPPMTTRKRKTRAPV